MHGPAEFRLFAANLRGSLPDIHIRLDDILAEGDRVTVRITLVGTHTGQGLGVVPTGNRVRSQLVPRGHLSSRPSEAQRSPDRR